ncbi:DUF2599 domain-containing protein [Krasilnikoviella flava]|uniref:DUF2599 domain-containing protein n=1 Tax=Krasilnikoviella flava TaxID=526729 RepID=A0A1T5KVM8_9MICO|nr:DUF2599 domain-containing protein [Krasilnikoviella flava]SKC67700.1 Protein of unknown function [Krasilnikoviella flava]
MPRRHPRARSRATPTRRPAAVLAAPAVLAVLALLTLGACTPSDPTPTAPATPSASPTPTTSSTADTTAGVQVAAGDVTLEVTAPGATVDDPRVRTSPGPDATTATVTIGAPPHDTDAASPPAAPRVALTSPGTLSPNVDGSVTVLDDGGAAVGGLTVPQGARLVALDGTHLEVRTTASGAERDEVTTTLGTAAVAGTDWGEREGGRSLAVEPTDWARGAGQAGVDLVWAELVATDPAVDVPTMRDQLECHAIGAPDKDTWNLEPWRPDVGLVATMAARCNPTP